MRAKDPKFLPFDRAGKGFSADLDLKGQARLAAEARKAALRLLMPDKKTPELSLRGLSVSTDRDAIRSNG
jgi:hypothetical protein